MLCELSFFTYNDLKSLNLILLFFVWLIVISIIKFYFVNKLSFLSKSHESFVDFDQNISSFNISGHVNFVHEIIY